MLAGRGWGKTRTGAEWVRDRVQGGHAGRVHLVGPTAADVRDVMVEGPSGILRTAAPDARPIYEPSKRRLTWPNGATATTFSADEPDRLRGPQCDLAWADELAAWRYEETWTQLRLGLRLGKDPRSMVTTTPRPTPIVRALIKEKSTTVTRGSTYDNRDNLAPDFMTDIVARFEGTRLGRQEIYAEVLDDTPGALWTHAQIDAHRVTVAPPLRRIVVAVDPSVTNSEGSAETGIVAAGADDRGHAYVLTDASVRASPDAWARAAVGVYHELRADRLVAEVNNGGDLVENLIRTIDGQVAYRAVHASRGKLTRAEPVAALYEQGRVHHVGGFATLEDQLCEYAGFGISPDRLDALCWAVTDLLVEAQMPNMAFDGSALDGVAPRPSPWSSFR